MQENVKSPTYLVARVNTDHEMTGKTHGSETCKRTLCGAGIGGKWIIISSSGDRTPSCQKCLKACGGI